MWIKRLKKMFSNGSAMWREWRMTGLLEERGLDVRQARIIGHGRSVWWGFVRGNAWDVAWGMNP